MAFRFPFSTLHELNLDWILEKVKTFAELIPPMEEATANVQQALNDSAEALQKSDTAIETADEAKTIAEQAAQAQIGDGAVTTQKLADHSVTIPKLASDTDEYIGNIAKYIKNKKIAIFGDSISDEDIQWDSHVNNVWTFAFRNLCSKYNATIVNYSKSSRGYCVKDSTQTNLTGVEAIQAADLSDTDTVILFMGINDFLQEIWLGSPVSSYADSLWKALIDIEPIIHDKNVFVVTPMKTKTRQYGIEGLTLDMYRICLANWAIRSNFMLINGSCIPQFYTGSNYFYDNIHPANNYTHIIADYIFTKMVAGGEQFRCMNEIAEITPADTANTTGNHFYYSATLSEYFMHIISTATGAVPANEVNLKTLNTSWQYVPINKNNSDVSWLQIVGTSLDSPNGTFATTEACYAEFYLKMASIILGQVNNL